MSFPTPLFFLVIVCALLGVGCVGEKWIGFYYPNGNDLTISRESPLLSSYEECLDWIFALQAQMNPTGEKFDDYECGKGCKKDKDFDVYICNTTVR